MPNQYTGPYTQEKRVAVFWSRVKINDLFSCWEWTGHKFKNGYGQFGGDGGEPVSTHRYVWELTYGKIPNGLMVLHKCDIRNCVNPNHLYVGTHQDNMNDMVNRDRASDRRGILNTMARLMEGDVRSIRNLLTTDTLQVDIAKRFNISKQTVSDIKAGRGWSHIK